METEENLITPEQIREWAGTRSFELGKRAFRTGALFSPRREGLTLRARCQGSTSLPYRAEAALASNGIESAHCTCGRGNEGRCKHIAALLFAWIEDPTTFVEAEPLDTTLERLSPQSLLTLLRRLIRHTDTVADLIEDELPFVAGTVASAEQVNVEALRREIAIALGTQRRPHYDDWIDAGKSETEDAAAGNKRLRSIAELGEDYLARSRFALATTVFRSIAEVTIEAAGTDASATSPETLRSTLRISADGLSRCLDGTAAAGLRRTIQHALMEISIADLSDTAVDTADYVNEIILTQATSDERQELATLLRERATPAVDGSPAGQPRLDALRERLEATPQRATTGAKG